MPNFTYIDDKLTRIGTVYEEYLELHKSNMTIEEFAILMKINGTIPGYMTQLEIITTSLIHLNILIFGIFLNLITCIVIAKNPAMRNVTNYYLFSLSVSDILFVIIGTIYSYFIYQDEIKNLPWIWSAAGCNILNFFSCLTQYTSVMMVLAFSIERYLAVCHPFSFNASSGRKRTIWITLACWVFCSACALFDMDNYLVEYDLFLPISGKIIDSKTFLYCEHSLTGSIAIISSIAIDVIFFFIPISTITFLYIKMWIKIQSSLKNCSRLGGGNFIYERYKESNRMLVTVVIMTFICWTPRQIIYSIHEYNFGTISSYVMRQIIYLGPIFNFISLSCTIIHPIIYNIMSAQYREGFREMLYLKNKLKIEITRKLRNRLDKTTSI